MIMYQKISKLGTPDGLAPLILRIPFLVLNVEYVWMLTTRLYYWLINEFPTGTYSWKRSHNANLPMMLCMSLFQIIFLTCHFISKCIYIYMICIYTYSQSDKNDKQRPHSSQLQSGPTAASSFHLQWSASINIHRMCPARLNRSGLIPHPPQAPWANPRLRNAKQWLWWVLWRGVLWTGMVFTFPMPSKVHLSDTSSEVNEEWNWLLVSPNLSGTLGTAWLVLT